MDKRGKSKKQKNDININVVWLNEPSEKALESFQRKIHKIIDKRLQEEKKRRLQFVQDNTRKAAAIVEYFDDIEKMREAGELDPETYKELMSEIKNDRDELFEKLIKLWELKYKTMCSPTDEDYMTELHKLEAEWDKYATPAELNEAIQAKVERIYYFREGNEVTLKILHK